jgi:hypothetical protein
MVTRGQRQRREEVLQARMCQGRKEDRLLLRNSRLCRSCHLGIGSLAFCSKVKVRVHKSTFFGTAYQRPRVLSEPVLQVASCNICQRVQQLAGPGTIEFLTCHGLASSSRFPCGHGSRFDPRAC